MKKIILYLAILLIALTSCTKKVEGTMENANENIKEKLYVYNWGIYIDKSVIGKFEDKYNCEVIYDEFDTNEEMYAVVSSGARVYDVLCPTDYMIEKMIKQGLLYEYDIRELPNYKNIDERILKIIKSFDKNNTYVVPYVHSTLGLIYNNHYMNSSHHLINT